MDVAVEADPRRSTPLPFSAMETRRFVGLFGPDMTDEEIADAIRAAAAEHRAVRATYNEPALVVAEEKPAEK